MKSLKNKTVAELVTQNIYTADIFKKYGIDYSCEGSISIEKACRKNGIDYNALIIELKNLHLGMNYLNDYNKWGLDFLMIFIVHTHHTYVRTNLPIIKKYSEKSAKEQGSYYKEFIELNTLIIQFSDELMAHLNKEETIVFPFIKKLYKAKKEGKHINHLYLNKVNNAIGIMEENHIQADVIFNKIADLTNKYKAPKDASDSFKLLCFKLQEFQDNLHHHVHLENNILFPKARKMELEILKN